MNVLRASFCVLYACVCAMLVACSPFPIKPEPIVVTKTEYVLRIPPADLLTPPPPVPKMDLTDQGEVAKWIVLQMERMGLLENKLIGVATFLKDEEQKLPPAK